MSNERPRTVLDKNEVLEGLFGSWDSLADLLSGLTDKQWLTPTALPGWTVRDVVAHMAGTELMLSGQPTPEIDVSDRKHVHNDIGALNQRWIEHLDSQTPAELLATFRDITAKRKATLSAMSDEEWNAVGFTPAGPDSYGRFMRVRIFDCWMHEHDIRDALKMPASEERLTGADTRLALDELEPSMAFVVGKKGQAPEGSRVMIALTGPVSRVLRVAVDGGRAALVDDFGPAEATAIIGMDGLQFTRLAGGRPMVADRPKGIDLGGDEELGNRIVENLAYVI